MADEVTTNTSEIVPVDADDLMFKDAMEMLAASKTEEKNEPKEAASTDQSAAEVKEETEKSEVVAETPQPDKPAETPPVVETAKTETKPIYTPDEIKAELRVHGDLARLDSSRLSEEGKLIQASMQSGLTPKLQKAAEIEKNYNALLQKAQEDANRRAKEEAERIHQKEVEEFGEEMANWRKDVREARAEIEQIKREREQERMAFQAEQQKVAAQQFHLSFIEKAKDYGIPSTPEWEELTMSQILAYNQIRAINNEPFISIEDGLRMVSKTVGIQDADGLDRLLSANPKLLEALENKFKEKYSKQKEAGPTIVKSSASGGGGKAEVKPITTTKPDQALFDNPNYDQVDDISQLAMKMLREQKG
jgi:hypothetical protein